MSDVDPGHFVRLVEMTDTDRVFMFSSDYPHYDADSASRVLSKAIPQELRERIRFRNAVETYPRLQGLIARLAGDVPTTVDGVEG